MDVSYRKQGLESLGTVLKQKKNIEVIERNVYKIIIKKYDDNHEQELQYKNAILQIIGDIYNEVTLTNILEHLKKGQISWDHFSYNEMADNIAEQNNFIRNPFEVEEGVFQCKQCGSKRVYSYARQDRSCDEGTSVYAECVACKAQWRERG